MKHYHNHNLKTRQIIMIQKSHCLILLISIWKISLILQYVLLVDLGSVIRTCFTSFCTPTQTFVIDLHQSQLWKAYCYYFLLSSYWCNIKTHDLLHPVKSVQIQIHYHTYTIFHHDNLRSNYWIFFPIWSTSSLFQIQHCSKWPI